MKKLLVFIKRYKATLIISCIAIIVSQCGGNKSATSSSNTTSNASKKVDPYQPQETDVAIAQNHWPGTTLTQLQQGYGIYSTSCNNSDCHDMKRIKDFSLDEWPDLIQKMGRKAKLDSTNYKLVYHYIMTRREALGN